MKARDPLVLVLLCTVLGASAALGAERPASTLDPAASVEAAASAADSEATEPAPTRDPNTATRLLLPFYETEVANFLGPSTLYALRNESTNPVEVTVRYYELDAPQAPQRTDILVLGNKEVRPIAIRGVENLEVDPDGIARGYVTFETTTPGAALQGDYFQATPGEGFAVGSRLVDLDTEVCTVLSQRFILGGGFDGGTQITLWLDVDSLPLPPAAVAYSLYGEGGGTPLKSDLLVIDEAAVRFSIEDLFDAGSSLSSGALEIQLGAGVRGHVSATFDASGLYSVGFPATCRD
ncbi:MAG: hypothetical protein AAGN46_03270 [Acidobacteriota bacterium]